MRKLVSLGIAILLISMITTAFAYPDKYTETDSLSEKVKKLDRSTEWKKVDKLDLNFNVYHPQGMTKVNGLFYISSVEIIEKPEKYTAPKGGYDRSPGKGIGHLFIVDENGRLVEDIELGEGNMYHPGGIDYDGESIWVPVSEYRPDSRSIIYKVDPETRKVTKVFEVEDHIGGVVKKDKDNRIYGVSWGSRLFYEWNVKGKQKAVTRNNSYFIDYQDCEGVDDGNMLCTGVAELPAIAKGSQPYELGGVALIDRKTKEIVNETPILEFSPKHHSITRNPVFFEKTKNGLKLFAVPDDGDASLLIYQTKIKK